MNQIRFAVAVADTQSFSQAAKTCFVTQPTLSNAIAQLEDQLGNKLFKRTTRSVSLTPFGEAILPKFEQLIIESENLLAFSKNWENNAPKQIRIGLSPVIDMMLLQQLISPFKKKHPQIDFYYQECYLDDLEDNLKRDRLDVIIMPPRITKLATESIHLYSEPLFYVPMPQQASKQTKYYTLQQASQHKLVLTVDVCGLREVTQNLFKSHDLHLNAYPGQATSYPVVEDWAKVGIGAGVLPHSKVSDNNLSAKPLMISEDQPTEINCSAYYRQNGDYAEHVDQFIKHLTSLN